MSEFFQPELPKKSRKITAKERRKHHGAPLYEIMQKLNGQKIERPVNNCRIFIENNRMKSNRFYWANK